MAKKRTEYTVRYNGLPEWEFEKKGITGIGGWWLDGAHGGSVYMPRGGPDIIGCFKGYFVAIEVKRPGEQPRKIQEHTLNVLRSRR